jgi:hypothetical protein
MFGGTNRAGAYQSLAVGYTTDGVYVPGGAIDLTTAYGVRGAFNHNWDPYWSSSLFGSYAAVRYNGNAQANYCAAFAAGVAGRSFLTSLAIRTSTLHSSAWSPAGLPSRT